MPSVATNTAFFIELYRRMLMVRQVEGRLAALFADGEIAGFIHLDMVWKRRRSGVPARSKGTLASNHRGHGHALGKGIRSARFCGDHGQGSRKLQRPWRLNARCGHGCRHAWCQRHRRSWRFDDSGRRSRRCRSRVRLSENTCRVPNVLSRRCAALSKEDPHR